MLVHQFWCWYVHNCGLESFLESLEWWWIVGEYERQKGRPHPNGECFQWVWLYAREGKVRKTNSQHKHKTSQGFNISQQSTLCQEMGKNRETCKTGCFSWDSKKSEDCVYCANKSFMWDSRRESFDFFVSQEKRPYQKKGFDTDVRHLSTIDRRLMLFISVIFMFCCRTTPGSTW